MKWKQWSPHHRVGLRAKERNAQKVLKVRSRYASNASYLIICLGFFSLFSKNNEPILLFNIKI